MRHQKNFQAFVFLGILMEGALLLAAPPSISNINPRGAQRGKTVTLVIEGANFTPDAELVSALSSPYSLVTADPALKPEANRLAFALSLNATEAPTPQLLRVRTKDGISNPVYFMVGALPEIKEEEPNDVPAVAKPVTLPVTINGHLTPTDRDTFRFPAKAQERLVFEVEARRLGSAVDPTLHLLRADGRELALSEDAYGLDVDARIDYTFKEAGEYLIQVHDAMYLQRNPDFYRLKIGSFPYADAVFPLGGRVGSDVQVTFEGGNLEAPVTTRVHFDDDPLARWSRVSLPVSMDAGGQFPFSLRLGTLNEMFEGPREKPDTVLPLSASAVLNGRIAAPHEVDRYSLDVAQGQHWVFKVEAAQLGSWLDPILSLFAEDGRKLLTVDDDGTNPDPRAEFAVPDGVKKLIIHVEDLHRRGGKPYGYRLTARPQKADFSLQLKTTQAALPVNGTALIEVDCVRRGYGGPVRLYLAAPPLGFTVRGGEILPDENKGYLTITGPEAAEFHFLDLVTLGTGGTAAEPMTRRAQGTVFLATDQNVPVSPIFLTKAACAIASAPPLRVDPGQQVVEVVVGHAAVVNVNALRKDGVAGEIKLTGILAPPGVAVAEGKIPADKSSGTAAINAAPNAALREGDLILAGTMKINNVDVAAPTPAFRVRVVRPFAAEVASAPLQCAPGASVVLGGKISRVAPFAGKVAVKVEGLPAGMTSAPVEIAGDKTDFQLQIAVPAAAAAGKVSVNLVFSTPLGDPKQPVVHALPPIAVALTVAPPAPAPAAAAVAPAAAAGTAPANPPAKPAEKSDGKK